MATAAMKFDFRLSLRPEATLEPWSCSRCVSNSWARLTTDAGMSGQHSHVNPIRTVRSSRHDPSQERHTTILLGHGDAVVPDAPAGWMPVRSVRDNGWRTAFYIQDEDCCAGAPPPPARWTTRRRCWFPVRSRREQPTSARRLGGGWPRFPTISTMKVDCPVARSSWRPTRVKMRSTRPMEAEDAGTKLPHLGHQHDYGDLPDVGGLAGHVGTGDEHDLGIVGIQGRVIGHE